jgi:hypothetical protein
MPCKGYTISKAPLKDIHVSELSSTFRYVKQQPIRLTNKLTGISKEFSSMTDAAKYLDISRARLGYFLSNMSNTNNDALKGYTVYKITDSQVKVNRKSNRGYRYIYKRSKIIPLDYFSCGNYGCTSV